ncbi:kinase-like protein [Penicillium canescens]|uniref:Kinase-like protein n=1 Tax=Penicillium canescens TaxID=5083 RepID=A0AAD6IH12_PENCN|nr:kinase-like protein [Penicillium canescens]KAJ6004451.1 kinase-like protein [Penicillium canescens]KAJ6029372.1 kinase-like protein [Penicillium canescens]KAJ6047803.1 kinase-like protein [Penicillium canescens]KAJ6048597.1 kinase-like protein [Penicillium canescens]KAJ6100888.1 kinase-like protein [Penicillium canescens]
METNIVDQDSSVSIDTFQGSYISNLVSSSKSIQIEYPTDAFDTPNLPLNTSVVWIHKHHAPRSLIRVPLLNALVNDSNVLKYLKQPEEGSKIHADAQILEILGNHPRIIRFHG